jgi:predicted transcriptional regulator of viral defense system
MVKKRSLPTKDKLFEIADAQKGYFTSRQAISSGIPDNNHKYYVDAGQWIKEERGIYRLKNYPVSQNESLMVTYLWTKNVKDVPQGVFSHQTALSLYELSDVNPVKIHITVPKSFRRSKPCSKNIVLHKKAITKSEISSFDSFKITSPLKTLLDVIDDGKMSDELIEQAVNQAYNRGLIIQKQINQHPEIKRFLKVK